MALNALNLTDGAGGFLPDLEFRISESVYVHYNTDPDPSLWYYASDRTFGSAEGPVNDRVWYYLIFGILEIKL